MKNLCAFAPLRQKSINKTIALAICTLLLAGCATAPAFDTRGADPGLTPDRAVADIEASAGRRVAWGGTILDARNLRDATQLEVLAYPLDRDGRPRRERAPLGRVWVIKAGYLETADFAAGRAVTAIGTLTEARTATVGEMELVYPVLTAERVQLWSERADRVEPRLHFGIGITIGN